LIIGLNGSNLALKQTGHGVDALKSALPDGEVCWALLTLRLTIENVEQPRYIFMQWKVFLFYFILFFFCCVFCCVMLLI
jgi:hypothetical protein